MDLNLRVKSPKPLDKKHLTPLSTIFMNENAEIQNGRWAMIGIFAALGTYAFTGQIIPGFF